MSSPAPLSTFIACLFDPDDLVEVRSLKKGSKAKQWWWRAESVADHADDLQALNADGWNIYAGVAPRKRDGGGKAEDVALVRALYADLDDCTVDQALFRLAGLTLPQPTLIIASGHGVHLYWVLDTAITGDALGGVGRDLDAIAVILDGDRKVKDLPRIMRIPGFMNVKDPGAPVPCTIYKAESERRYSIEEFADAIQAGNDRKKARQARRSAVPKSDDRKSDLSYKTRLFLAEGADDGERNDRLFQAACDMKGCGWCEEEAAKELVSAATRCGLSDEEARRTIKSAFEKPREPARHPGDVKQDLPTIEISNRQMREVVNEAWDAVIAGNTPKPVLFVHGGFPARIVTRENGPVIDLETETSLYGRLARAANWIAINKDGEEVSVAPPKYIAPDMLVYPRSDLPPLDGLIFGPVFGANYEIIEQPGYYREHRLAFCRHRALIVDTVPRRPSRAEVAAARDFILIELFSDFPFVGESDLAHALAALILPFARRMIQGCTPLHAIEAPTPGTGKGLLTNLISIVATGAACDARTLPESEDEVRKRLTAELTLGRPLILLDNQNTGLVLNSPTLASVLTAEWWTDRILGHTKMVTVPNQALWMMTGNNPRYSMEIARRSVRIRLDARIDRPWARQDFLHRNITEWALEHRPELVLAILILIQNWIASGRVPFERTLGSFESWARVIGGILQAAEVPGFLGNLEDLYETADAEGGSWREFTAAWFQHFGAEPKRVAELNTLCEDRELMMDIRGNGNDRSRQTRLGKALAKARDRVFGPYRIILANDDQHGGRTYRLDQVERAGGDGRCRTSSPERPDSQPAAGATSYGSSRTLGDVFEPDRPSGAARTRSPLVRGQRSDGELAADPDLGFDWGNVPNVPPTYISGDDDEGCAYGRWDDDVPETSPDVPDDDDGDPVGAAL